MSDIVIRCQIWEISAFTLCLCAHAQCKKCMEIDSTHHKWVWFSILNGCKIHTLPEYKWSDWHLMTIKIRKEQTCRDKIAACVNIPLWRFMWRWPVCEMCCSCFFPLKACGPVNNPLLTADLFYSVITDFTPQISVSCLPRPHTNTGLYP